MKLIRQFFNLYADGFKNLGWLGKRLWIIILIKIFIMFAILKLFFFENQLNKNFETDSEKSEHIINVITNQK
jgi:hypothetical protein